jgi:hypothetical protein
MSEDRDRDNSDNPLKTYYAHVRRHQSPKTSLNREQLSCSRQLAE